MRFLRFFFYLVCVFLLGALAHSHIRESGGIRESVTDKNVTPLSGAIADSANERISTMLVKNINDYPKESVAAGVKTFRQVLIGPEVGPHFAMRRFIIEPGGEMPLHTNTVEHEQFVLAGRARLVLGREAFEVKKHDVVFIPEGVKHSYKQIGDEAFEFLCLVPNEKDVMEIIR